MKIRTFAWYAALVCSLVFAGSLLSQQNAPRKADEAAVKTSLDRASILRNFEVKNTKGEQLGRVRDFLIDVRAGRVLYAVVGHGGTLGIGEKYVAVPLHALRIETAKDQPKERYFVLDMDAATFANNPGFNKDDWPIAPEQHFLKVKAPPVDDKTLVRRATVLIGMAAKNAKGESLGTIRDLMIDVQQETVIYAALGHGGGVLTAEKLFAVPFDAMEVKSLTGRADDECCVLNVENATLDQQAGFNNNQWPTEGDRTIFKNDAKR